MARVRAYSFATSGRACRESGDRPLAHCAPLSPTVRRSFRHATIEDLVIKGREASVRFSNGVVVDFVDGGPHSPWLVHALGNTAGRLPN